LIALGNQEVNNLSRPYEGIAASYDGVSVADVHAALAYAFDNPDTLQEIEHRAHDAIEHIRKKRPVDPEEFAERA
jgi:hypothetical protein